MRKSINFSNSRRTFINNGLRTAALLPITGMFSKPYNFSVTQKPSLNREPDRPLKILILGGTSFLGPHQIAYAMGRGHSITTFTRGKTKPTIYGKLFDQVEQLVGDRENDLKALKGRSWDAVIDNSGQKVHWTKATAELLKDQVDLYAYTSTVSVYYPYYKANVDEGASLVLKAPEQFSDEDEKMNYAYGVMKANSEIEARNIFGGDRTIIVRPTFMAGPSDRTNRFIYWPTKLAKGGDIVIPGKAEDLVQYIDVRDVAEWMIRLVEQRLCGTFNGVGPASEMTVPAFVYGAHAAFSSKVNFVPIDDYDFLQKNNFTFQAPWVMNLEKYHGISRVNNEHAISNGLTFRPLSTSIRDVHNWWYSEAVSDERRAQFNSNENALHNRQAELIQAYLKK